MLTISYRRMAGCILKDCWLYLAGWLAVSYRRATDYPTGLLAVSYRRIC